MLENRGNAPKILEVTLRDGSYVINFQFTAGETAAICEHLEGVGFDLIEVGHGVGLGASERGYGVAAESDEAYMEAAASSLKTAQWGMFCIPGIATLEHVDLAAEYGMDFIRLGTNVTEVELSAPFVERAKKHGMFVCANYMKSYAIEPEEFAKKALLSEGYGVDLVYIVDSAGGMLASEMEGYFKAVQAVTDIPIGFHGHNNLELAVANSVRAAELGAAIVDTSLQGMGRSAGNTPTEIFILVMERLGYRMGLNPLEVMDLGERLIKPMFQKDAYNSIDLVSGFSQFHSSYMKLVREFSTKLKVDPRKLIMAVCEESTLDASRELVERAAQRVSEESDEMFSERFRLHRYHGTEQLPPAGSTK